MLRKNILETPGSLVRIVFDDITILLNSFLGFRKIECHFANQFKQRFVFPAKFSEWSLAAWVTETPSFLMRFKIWVPVIFDFHQLRVDGNQRQLIRCRFFCQTLCLWRIL